METTNTPAFEPDYVPLPFPADFDDQSYESVAARASALCGAAEMIFQQATASGQSIVVGEEARAVSRDVFSNILPVSAIQTTAEGIHLTALLNAYDITVVQSHQQLRNFCTNILIDIAGDAANKKSDRLNAVKLLGQIKDVALFEERSTVLVQNMTTEQIKMSLKDKLALLRANATNVEVTDVPETR